MIKYSSFNSAYWYLVLLRITLVCLPQTGYIHPDEFFQSVEVLAGRFLDVEYNPPWEFNTTFPIRSMTIPYFTIGMCYKFLRDISNIAKEYLPLSPYVLLVAPRLLMCTFSFLVDYCLYKICTNNNEKYKSRLLVLSSSYVMLVYATRTFSNTVELMLFSMLLYFVTESLTFSNIVTRKREYINYRYEKSKSCSEKAKFHKLQLYIESDLLRNCFTISTITVLGFFNRPTFIAFAIIPVFFWLYRGLNSKSVSILQFHIRILFFILCSIPSLISIIVIDSFYYGYITWGEIGMWDVSINSFIFTPLNFLKYNLNAENLSKHGLHPRFLHTVVNIPLLFNVLGICEFILISRYAYLCFWKKLNQLPTVRSIKCLMTLSFLVPLILLSYFPHQEPRFLIPLVVPLVYLQGTKVLPEYDDALVANQQIHPKLYTRSNKKSSEYLLKTWILLNTLLTIFYGFLHQGGLYQATVYLAKDLKLTPLSTNFHIVTSHVYSLPESFLLQKPSNRLYRAENTKYSVRRRVHLYEEGSKDIDHISQLLRGLIESNTKKSKVYLLISSSLEDELNHSVGMQYLNFCLLDTFYPHISIEAFPDLTTFCLEFTAPFYNQNCSKLSYQKYISKIITSFGLSLYEISLNNTH